MNADLAKGHSRCLRPASASRAVDQADYFYISFVRVGSQQPFGKLNNCAFTTDFARNVLCGQLVPIAGWRECERSSRRKLTLRPFGSRRYAQHGKIAGRCRNAVERLPSPPTRVKCWATTANRCKIVGRSRSTPTIGASPAWPAQPGLNIWASDARHFKRRPARSAQFPGNLVRSV